MIYAGCGRIVESWFANQNHEGAARWEKPQSVFSFDGANAMQKVYAGKTVVICVSGGFEVWRLEMDGKEVIGVYEINPLVEVGGGRFTSILTPNRAFTKDELARLQPTKPGSEWSEFDYLFRDA